MPNYSRNDIILVTYPFSDLSGSKLRPAIIISAPHVSQDIFVIPLTSQISSLLGGEFVLVDWQKAELNVPTAVKRGIYTVHDSLIKKKVDNLTARDAETTQHSSKSWLGIK